MRTKEEIISCIKWDMMNNAVDGFINEDDYENLVGVFNDAIAFV